MKEMENYKIGHRAQNSGNAAVSQWTPERMRLAGLAGIVGGVLWALWPVGTEFFFTDSVRTDIQAVAAVAYALFPLLPAMLIMFELAGLHQFHGRTYGRVGLLGVTVSGGVLALMASGLAIERIDIFVSGGTSLSGIAHGRFFLGFLVLLLGSIVLGVAVWRADRLLRARWLGLLLAVAIPAGIVMVILKESIAPTPVDSDLYQISSIIPKSQEYDHQRCAIHEHTVLFEYVIGTLVGKEYPRVAIDGQDDLGSNTMKIRYSYHVKRTCVLFENQSPGADLVVIS